jgi:hypothetical protein
MARDYGTCKEFGRFVAGGKVGIAELSRELVSIMRTSPPAGSLTNAIWGYVSSFSTISPVDVPLGMLLREIQ